jgi:ABC-2 type transport system permease protein
MFQILSKELNSFLNSLIAYVVIGVFLIAIGLLMWIFPETSVLEYGYADLDTLFSLGPYVFIFLVPAITMRTFAEENKSGTIELLITKPVTSWEIILGKFTACLVLVLAALLPTLVYYYSIYLLGNPVGNVDTAGIIGSYIGLVLIAAVFCSIGVFASSITRNQIIAFITGAFLCFFLFTGFESISTLDIWSDYSLFIKQLGLLEHYDALSKGLIDSRDVVYFLSVIFILLSLTKLILSSAKW